VLRRRILQGFPARYFRQKPAKLARLAKIFGMIPARVLRPSGLQCTFTLPSPFFSPPPLSPFYPSPPLLSPSSPFSPSPPLPLACLRNRRHASKNKDDSKSGIVLLTVEMGTQRESDTRYSTSVFFHESVFPGPLSIPLGSFRLFRKFAEITANECLSAVSTTLIYEKNLQSKISCQTPFKE
jgi:hypothetical protein